MPLRTAGGSEDRCASAMMLGAGATGEIDAPDTRSRHLRRSRLEGCAACSDADPTPEGGRPPDRWRLLHALRRFLRGLSRPGRRLPEAGRCRGRSSPGIGGEEAALDLSAATSLLPRHVGPTPRRPPGLAYPSIGAAVPGPVRRGPVGAAGSGPAGSGPAGSGPTGSGPTGCRRRRTRSSPPCRRGSCRASRAAP